MFYQNPEQSVTAIIKKLGSKITIAVPLGLGKPTQLLNALYRHAQQNPDFQLTILTALSFVKPQIQNELEQRLAQPILDRLYNNYIDLEHEIDRRNKNLPTNVKILEFYLTPGNYINNSAVQQDYISSNYTHVIRDCLSYKINILAQLISSKHHKYDKFSLSCNADLTIDMLQAFDKNIMFVGEINTNLPYMYGESAEVNADKFDLILDPPNKYNLFVIPRPAITEQDFMIGLYSSTLIKDNGCIQIGIGSFGDALVQNLILRHNNNLDYLKLLKDFNIHPQENNIFSDGLFASTEMLVESFIDLYKNNILKKIDINNHIAHAGFFVGSAQFYKYLSNLSESERRKFDMRGVRDINQIHQRKYNNARFVNSCMKVTLLGAVISDTLENNIVVSGVGGQYNFVSMAHELEGASSIINCRSTYNYNGTIKSNIVWEDTSAVTIPRHLRDIVVTEYGIAHCRSKTDSEVIKELLNITDSRFQDQLLSQAKKYGKINQDYQIPKPFRNNSPANIFRILKKYQENKIYQRYPFGTDLTQDEIQLEIALKYLKTLSKLQYFIFFIKGIFISARKFKSLLIRMQLERPKNIKEYIYRNLLLSALQI